MGLNYRLGGFALSPVRSETITLAVEDGTSMRGWLARPAAGSPRAGLLIFQEAFGVNAHIRAEAAAESWALALEFLRIHPGGSRAD